MREILQGNQKTISEELRLSFAEQLLAQAQVLVEQDQRLNDLENELVELKNRVEELESVVVNGPEDYVSVAGYARTKNIPVSRSVIQHLVRKAKKLSKARGAEIYRTRDGLFDTAETFRIDILDDVFAAFGV